MTFDPKYCPDRVDFVIIDDMWGGFCARTEAIYKELFKDSGIEINVRSIKESEMRDSLSGYQEGVDLSTITKDSIVFIHGDMTHKLNGVYSAFFLSEESDTRVIVTYASGFYRDVREIAGRDLSFTPKEQVSFLENSDIESALKGEPPMDGYFEQLSKLRD